MKLVIQRVNSASVTIENKLYSSINKGLLVLFGVEKDDKESVGWVWPAFSKIFDFVKNVWFPITQQ